VGKCASVFSFRSYAAPMEASASIRRVRWYRLRWTRTSQLQSIGSNLMQSPKFVLAVIVLNRLKERLC